MLVGFIGRMGQGKTLSMTVFGTYLAYKSGARLKARHQINALNAELVTKVSQVWDTDNAIFLWDELWIDMDSRDYQNNIDLTQFINQSRKKNAFVGYTAQHNSQVEKRVRKATDYLIHCEKIVKKEKDGTKNTSHKLIIVDPFNGKILRQIIIRRPETFYKLYNTYEVIQPLKNDMKKEYQEPRWKKKQY